MPGNEVSTDDVDQRKYTQCDHCDYICGTEEGLEIHNLLRHSSEVGDE